MGRYVYNCMAQLCMQAPSAQISLRIGTFGAQLLCSDEQRLQKEQPTSKQGVLEWKIPRGGAREEQIVLDEDKLKDVFKKQLTSSYQVR